MFLNKIRDLTRDLSCTEKQFEDLAREALFYGLRVQRSPLPLKKAFKSLGLDEMQARPLWSGNAYLLFTLVPELLEGRRKITCVEDYQFARKHLTKANLAKLRTKAGRKVSMTRDEVFWATYDNIRRSTQRSNFLTWLDPMYEKEDLQVKAMELLLETVNREYYELKTDEREGILKYMGYCFETKYKTELSRSAPRWYRDNSASENLEVSLYKSQQNGSALGSLGEVELSRGLTSLLSELEQKAVMLLLDQADEKLERCFDNFLQYRFVTRADLTQNQLKSYIDQYLGSPVLKKMKKRQDLKSFLKRPTESDWGDVQESGSDDFEDLAGHDNIF